MIEKNQNIAIKISGVKKKYRLGELGSGTFARDFQRWLDKKLGKEDKNILIGQDQRIVGETFMALNGIDLTIYKGQAVGIIGCNGAGKSTLLKLLSRITAPTEGEIDIYGRVTSMLEVGTGFHQEMTGRENVYLNGAILGMTKAEIDKKMDQIIEFSEVGEFIDTPVKRYSSGMYVKLAFAVAAHLDSEIMIMDEVLAVGDMKFQQKCLGKMSDSAANDKKTILYVSHNMNTIRQLCSRCIVLNQGKVVYDGDVESAIAVYLQNSFDECRIENDYRNTVRMPHLRGFRDISLEHCTLLGKEVPIYKDSEMLSLRIYWKVNKSVDNLRFRFEYRRNDDTPVGVSIMKQSIDANTCCVDLQTDISALVSGTYKVLLCAYQTNEYGARRDIDAVWPAFVFMKEAEEGIDWLGIRWGYVQFPEIQVVLA